MGGCTSTANGVQTYNHRSTVDLQTRNLRKSWLAKQAVEEKPSVPIPVSKVNLPKKSFTRMMMSEEMANEKRMSPRLAHSKTENQRHSPRLAHSKTENQRHSPREGSGLTRSVTRYSPRASERNSPRAKEWAPPVAGYTRYSPRATLIERQSPRSADRFSPRGAADRERSNQECLAEAARRFSPREEGEEEEDVELPGGVETVTQRITRLTTQKTSKDSENRSEASTPTTTPSTHLDE
jgi:hypothetical protein